MSHEIRQALRALRKRPVVSLTAIATLSLGISASTAIFGVVEAVLLRPLPYAHGNRLVVASGEMRNRNVTDLPLSAPDFLDFRRAATTFEDLAAIRTERMLVPQADGTPEAVRIASVSPTLLTLLGAPIAVGRHFIEADRAAFSSPETGVAILSYEYWQRRYGGSAAALNQVLALGTSGRAQIVGVLAPRFELLFPPHLNVERAPDVWLAADIDYDVTKRSLFAFRVIGRLKPGASMESARAEAETIAAEWRRDFLLWQTADFHLDLKPLHDAVVARVTPAILALMGAAICLLLIACANVANILLVRSSVRQRELAVRTALGGSRWRLIRHMLAEAMVLAMLGTVVGIVLTWIGLRVLLAIAPPDLPRLDSVTLNPLVFGFAGLVGLIAAGIFGVVPVWRGSRTDVMSVLRASGRTARLGSGRRLGHSVVIVEIALSFLLLVGSGLMLRSFVTLQTLDPGFVARGLLTFQILGPRAEEPRQREAIVSAIRERLGAIPGVEHVTAASPFPLADRPSPIRWGTDEALTDASKFQAVDFQAVLPGYFETLETRLLAGRPFTSADNSPERQVVIIDELLAAKAFPREPAVGKRMLIRIRTPDPEWVEVIGVVGHQRANALAELGREQVYFTDGFLGHGAANRWAIRTTGDPAAYASVVRSAIAAVGGRLAVSDVQPMDALVHRSQASTRFTFVLIGVFGSISALLAAVGIYGVLSTMVSQRTAEFGVRMAVGAGPSSIVRLIVTHGFILGFVGVTIGIAAALFLTKVMTSMLVGVSATDPLTFIGMALLFVLIVFTAAWLPGRRAADLDPLVALRDE